MPTQKFTNEIINAAIEGFEVQKRRIEEQIVELRAMLSGGRIATVVTPEVAPKQRKRFSAAARRKMAAAQKARWAKLKGDVESASPKPQKAKRKMSEAGRRAISEATKKRWALKKAEAAPVSKKSAGKKSSPARSAKKVSNKAVKKSAAKRKGAVAPSAPAAAAV